MPPNSSTLPVSLPLSGMGALQPLPSGSANGAPLPGTRPAGATALRIYLKDGDTAEWFFVRNTQNAPSAPPVTTSGPVSGPAIIDEFFPPELAIYFVGGAGTPTCRWM